MKSKKKQKQDNIAYLLILPSYIVFTVMILIPIIWAVAMSFTDYDFKSWNFIGFQNYIDLFHDSVFLKALWNTVRYALLTILPEMILALILAVLLNLHFRGRGIFRTMFYLPNILSMVAVSLAWGYLFNAQAGIFNRIIRYFGGESVGWLTDPNVAMISVAIMSVWSALGYYALLYLSGLQGIPQYLYEAAVIDGAGTLQRFRYITIPGLRPTTFFIFVMACIHSFEVFGQIFILTNGGPLNSTTTLAHQIYLNGFEYYKMGYASAEAVILLLIILAITLINMKFGGSGDEG